MNALDTQEGGSHYKKYAIQPIEFISANKLDYLQGNVIKYVCRHKDKNGKEDILKAIHYLELILTLQYHESETQMPDSEGTLGTERITCNPDARWDSQSHLHWEEVRREQSRSQSYSM